MSGCGTCEKMRSHLPQAIRARLEQHERNMQARKAARVQLSYRVDLPPKEVKRG